MNARLANDPLLRPYRLKHLTLKNRVMSTSHEPAYSEDGMPKERYRLYHAEKAKGGMALTMTAGSAIVSRDSPAAFGNLHVYRDEIVPWLREVGPQGHFLGTQHTLEHFESAFFMPTLMDFNSYEQWNAEGAKDHDTRGREKARNMLKDYEEPRLDEGVAEGLRDFVALREEKLPDTVN